MSDRRLTPCNGRVADARLRGTVAAGRFVTPEPRSVTAEAPFLHAAPDGPRDRQLLHGDRFDVLEAGDGWCFGSAARDGYVGYVAAAALGPAIEPTHAVAVRQTHLYPAPDLKQPPLMPLSFGAALRIDRHEARWAGTGTGWVPGRHLRPIGELMPEPVAVAELFLGAPYLWAGNAAAGLDCSALVQLACLACGIACPGDSDLQEAALGTPLDPGAPLRRGDLLFWKGHVAWVADAARILHANAFHMMVAYEGTEAAIARIEAQGDGPVTSRRRL